jgi:hypothetical protein
MSKALSMIRPEVADELAAALKADDALLAASTVVATMQTGFKVESDDDVALAVNARAILKRGLNKVEEGLRDLFADAKAFERKIRDTYARPQEAMKRAVATIDGQLDAYDRKKRREAEERRIEDQRVADALAKAETLAREAFGEHAPPAVDIIREAPPENTMRGPGARAHFVSRPHAEVLNLVVIAQSWPHLLKFDEQAALREFRVLRDRGELEAMTEAGVRYQGVRFYETRSVAGGAS